MRFIGIDLAWKSEKNSSSAAALGGNHDAMELLTISSDLTGITAVMNFITSYACEDTAVAIDAPLIIKNYLGQRPCETEIGRRFGKYKASAHTSNLKLYPAASSVRLAEALCREGFSDIVDPRSDLQRSGRWFFEVYPHPAHVILFELSERIPYKKGTNEQKRQGLRTYQRLLREKLPEADPPLSLTPALSQILHLSLSDLRGQVLKRYEDTLDAVFCAYLAFYYWYWANERNEMIGDLMTGYIINPTHPAVD